MNENVESSFVKIKAFTMLYTLVSSHNVEKVKRKKKKKSKISAPLIVETIDRFSRSQGLMIRARVNDSSRSDPY